MIYLAFPLKTFGARAIVRLDNPETEVNGIIIPTAQNEPVHKGEIVAVGNGTRLDNGSYFPMEVKVGDYVIFSPMAGVPVEVPGDDNKYLVINEAHILCVVDKK